jgi:hypothetical protein
VHDPGKTLLEVALAVALGGDYLSDVMILRAEPALFGPVASDPTVSRLVDTLAGAGSRALDAIRRARAEVREHVWKLAGNEARNANGQVVVDIDGVPVLAHSDMADRPGFRSYQQTSLTLVKMRKITSNLAASDARYPSDASLARQRVGQREATG